MKTIKQNIEELIRDIKTGLNKLVEKNEELLKKLASIPHDKALHFLYGHLTFNFFLIFFATVPALIITTGIAAFKEYYDYKVPGHEASFMDFVYGVAPGIIQTLVGLK